MMKNVLFCILMIYVVCGCRSQQPQEIVRLAVKSLDELQSVSAVLVSNAAFDGAELSDELASRIPFLFKQVVRDSGTYFFTFEQIDNRVFYRNDQPYMACVYLDMLLGTRIPVEPGAKRYDYFARIQEDDDEMPDYTGKRVVVIGGGNVAMDVARSSVRLGAEKVSIVYRRRKADMTALPEEVEGAEAEGCDVLELMSPVRIEKDENDAAVGLWVQPQMISRIKGGRPSPKTAAKDEVLIPCDLIVVAIGQGIETRYFEEHGVTVKRGTIEALDTSEIKERKGIFAGGDCVTGPATVIRAIAAGKVAAANIDEYLGYHHEITSDVEIPYAGYEDKVPCGRVEVALRDAADRKKDFEPIEYGFSCEEACQESGRCLRCDHFGFGSFRGGREKQW